MRALLALLIVAGSLSAQYDVTAWRLRRAPGTPPASTCTSISPVGQVYVDSNAGGQAYVCLHTGVNTYAWTPTGSGGGGGAVSSVFGRTGVVTAQSGDYTTTLVTEGTNLYFTNTRVRAAVSASSPLAFNSGTGVFAIQVATTSQPGYLASADWNLFNGKENVLTFLSPLSRSVNSISCPTCSVTGHTHAGTDLTSGTVPTARLGSGTADSTKFLRGDNTWQVPPAGTAFDAFALTRTSTTVLTLGTGCSASTPCNFRIGGAVTTITSTRTITITSATNTGKVLVYISNGGGIIAGSSTGLNLDCTGGCTAVGGVDYFPADSIPLWEWTANSVVGEWDSAGGTDRRAPLSGKVLYTGNGITRSDNTGTGATTISVDTTVVGLRVSVPSTAVTACSSGQWAADTSYYYSCVADSTWRRVAIASW